MKKESRTYIAIPPGATIREQIIDREMTQKELSQRLGISEKHLSRLINGEVELTPETAYKLEMVLGVPSSFWLNLETIFQEKCQKAEEENLMDEDLKISKNYPYAAMAKNEWVPSTRDPIQRVENLRRFFRVYRLALVPKIRSGLSCRKLSESEKTDYALFASAQQAKIISETLETAPINLARLQEIIPEIRKMTDKPLDEVFIPMRELLSECGIALVLLPVIGGAYLHGATFVSGKKIVLGLTIRGKDSDKFWFSFFHEIGHIINGDIFETDQDGETQEKNADLFSSDTLIHPDDYETFIRSDRITENSITAFSRSIGIAPGIVVGRLQKDNRIPYTRFNYLKQKYRFPF